MHARLLTHERFCTLPTCTACASHLRVIRGDVGSAQCLTPDVHDDMHALLRPESSAATGIAT